jgi:hypothetical protein
MKEVAINTIRIGKDLKTYKKTKRSWKKTSQKFPEIIKVVKLFKAHKNFKTLIDTKNPKFLKGQLSSEGQPQGARINILPDNQKLDKAYSLFAKHLTFHDQDSHDHWDVIYQNKGGTYAYCYTLEKKRLHSIRKYKKVHEFAKVYNKLSKNVEKSLKDKEDHLAIPMYTLLKTHMRIGNEIYFKAHGHKGLTTLKKNDIKIRGSKVIFNYLAKDGVPRLIEQKFPVGYINRLKTSLKKIKKEDFVFASCKTGHPLGEIQFKKAFKNYCGKEFYPHIVRSHFATSKVKSFLKNKRKATKEEVNSLFLSIAAKLGHKKFVKKEQVWKNNYSVTINHYIQPDLVERVKEIIR